MVFDAPPAQPVHAWMPSSSCGSGCIETTDRVGAARLAARVTQIAGLMIGFPIVNALTPRGRREAVQREFSRALLGTLGIKVRVIDNRVAARTVTEPAQPDLVTHIGAALRRDDRGAQDGEPVVFAPADTGVLVVTGHIGWTDVVALAAVQPLGFVARADLIEWPLLGKLAERVRVIPIERERLRALPGVVATIAARLSAGERVAAFPEGTTWCGRAYGRMRPALFQAAIDAGAYVQPVRLRYLDRHGAPCSVPGFVGDDTFATSALRILRSRGIVAEITLEPLEHPGLDRRDLAQRCERAVRAAEQSVHSTDPTWIEATTTRVEDPTPRPRRRTIPLFRGRSRDATPHIPAD